VQQVRRADLLQRPAALRALPVNVPPAARKCETDRCEHAAADPQILPATHERAIQMSTGKVPTLRWSCECGWARSMPMTPQVTPARDLTTSGWTASVSPCAPGDVDAR
jgi:hypothetical protein